MHAIANLTKFGRDYNSSIRMAGQHLRLMRC